MHRKLFSWLFIYLTARYFYLFVLIHSKIASLHKEAKVMKWLRTLLTVCTIVWITKAVLTHLLRGSWIVLRFYKIYFSSKNFPYIMHHYTKYMDKFRTWYFQRNKAFHATNKAFRDFLFDFVWQSQIYTSPTSFYFFKR